MKTVRKKIIATLLVLSACLAVYFVLPDSCPEAARRTAAIFVFAAFFWALEIIPLYATSILIVLFEILLLARPEGVLDMDRSGYRLFLMPLSSPIIILFFGGFALAESFRKYGVDRQLAGRLLILFGQRPYFIMLGFMVTTAFLSMWISNTATSALMIAMIIPLLMGMSNSDPFQKGLVLAIAFAANIGGTMTPVGSPPNAIAIGMLTSQGVSVNFLNWMILVLPLAVALLFLNSLFLIKFFPPKSDSLQVNMEPVQNIDRNSFLTLTIGVITVLCWLTSQWHGLPEPIVSLLCVGMLMAVGVFSKDDLKQIHWDILILMWGGLALGEGMRVSGLADWIVGLSFFSQTGIFLILLMCVTSVLLSSFMSNTAAVNLLIPLSISLAPNQPFVLAAIVALASSFNIALPVSTPPMAIAYGTGRIKVADMLKVGGVFSVVANLALLAYFWLILAVFPSILS